ncbi:MULTISPECIES: 3-isopropylmalate dehydratase large subunit [unclassified Olsenella]|jgi:3-isopropylmalate/(R)-2-methylmalate dehydratase large subunit|uniref:3-isopropylmalate dehydratase large subunit n=1 Tax=unclassified Olsenella TaxID=2638792 RepID=UPI0018F37159|nr:MULTISPECIES: 3-isopropylmalate dehydratase large subunit [unclassified Olsenella]
MARPMTMAEKILAAHAGLPEVVPGQLIECDLDLVLANDITAPIAIKTVREIGAGVFDRDRICLVPDHYSPNKDIKSAEQTKVTRDFAHEMGITHYFEQGCMGIEHALLPERGIVGPGDLVIGADSHTCTYGGIGAFSTGVGSTDAGVGMAIGRAWFKVPETIRFEIDGKLPAGASAKDIILYVIGKIGVDGALYCAMEFAGSTIRDLSVEGRLTIANMAIEAGGKAGLFEVDDTARAWLEGRTERPYTEYHPDPDAIYKQVIKIDAADVVPQVSWPHLPSNTHPVAESRDITIDQAVIGSCTNGRIEDMRAAAEVLRGRTVNPNVRCIVIPATQAVWLQCVHEGLMDVFIDAHCVVSTPTCGPCLGGYMGILAAGEKCVSSTNRNFVGRMGDPTSEVYLASPAVCAASAVAGHIALPSDL